MDSKPERVNASPRALTNSSGTGAVPPRMAVMWTLAPTQVAFEPYQRLFVQLALCRVVLIIPIYEAEEVFRRSEMFASRNGGVAGFR